jgi:hypothetical protein
MSFRFTSFLGGFAEGARLFFFASLLSLVLLDARATSPGETQAPTMAKEELRALLGKPDVVVIDVRLEEQWKFSNRKIPGALHENPSVPDNWFAKLPRDKTIVFYCA